jgi:hypothetical protein
LPDLARRSALPAMIRIRIQIAARRRLAVVEPIAADSGSPGVGIGNLRDAAARRHRNRTERGAENDRRLHESIPACSPSRHRRSSRRTG